MVAALLVYTCWIRASASGPPKDSRPMWLMSNRPAAVRTAVCSSMMVVYSTGMSEPALSEAIGAHELRAHVYRLASPDFLGRRGVGAARASRHIAEAFQRLRLKPAFGDSYFQPIPWLLAQDQNQKDSFIGRNVGAVLPGTDPDLKDEWVVLSAHFDHLGVKDGVLYPGADDNASGVAMLLEVAERFALQKVKPRRTIVFVAFDQEEAGLIGSRHFASHPPRDLKKLKVFLTADMLGRSMANLMDG